jgi:phosphoenolpyruvate synthase/pyruvate phosphate dikinase
VSYIAWLHEGKLPRDQLGGKGASLSNMTAAGFHVPAGFCVVAEGYRHFAAAAGLDQQIAQALASVDPGQPATVKEATQNICSLVSQTPLPDDLRDEIGRAYKELTSKRGFPSAVRSSAVSEDGSAASFAGLYESYLNVRELDSVLDAVRSCYVSLWSERALGYRARKGSGADEAMAVVVMDLVPSETSGIAFTAHPVTGSLDLVVINASFGLGEAVVSGRVTPDSFVVSKTDFALHERDIFPKELAIYPNPEGGGTIEKELPHAEQHKPSLTDGQACDVARLAVRVEEHYGSPQDIEWGMAGGELFVLQSRPITTLG